MDQKVRSNWSVDRQSLARSTTSIASARSRVTVSHSLPGSHKPVKWWQRRPIIGTAFITDLQKGSYFAAVYTLVQSAIQIIISIFDAYCLLEARRGSRHFRTFGFSFLFVYSGNEHVRRALIASAVVLIGLAMYLLVSSIILMAALKKEHEVKFRHWIRAMAMFIVLRSAALIFQSITNDLYFFYHKFMLVFWLLLTIVNVFVFLVVVSNFQELSNITRLEDMAKLKMSTLSSLNASRSLSHHSLDSYKGYAPSVQGTPAAQRGSTSSAGTYNNQPSPRTGYTLPLTAFGYNLNPSGRQPSPRSHQGSLGGMPYTQGSTPSTAPI